MVSLLGAGATDSVSVFTSTDGIAEGDEMFQGVLSLAPGSERINLGANIATAVIRNVMAQPNPCQYTRMEL